MPTGEHTYTYTGPEAEITVSGVKFIKDQPTTFTDMGTVGMIEHWPEFVDANAKPKKAAEPVAEPEPAPEPAPTPEKPKAPRKAKGKKG